MGGHCICHRKEENFSMNDLIRIEKYYSFISKRKLNILMWIKDSKGPWKTPDSFLYFKQIDNKINPIKISNEDEIKICALQLKSNINNQLTQTSNLHVDQEEMRINLNSINSTLSGSTSTNINNEQLLDWPNDW